MHGECYLCAWRVAVKCDHCEIPFCERCKKEHDERLRAQGAVGKKIVRGDPYEF